MAAAFRFWGKLGYGDGVAGHITVRDPVLHDHYWWVSFVVELANRLVLIASLDRQDEPDRCSFLGHDGTTDPAFPRLYLIYRLEIKTGPSRT